MTADDANELRVIADEIEPNGLQEERHRAGLFGKEALPEGFNAGFNARLALKCAVYDRAGMNTPAAVFPSEGDMHHEIEHPETLAGFGWPPYDRDADAGNEALHQVAALSAELDFIERDELDLGI